jgi:endonuclease/exonuclease/phosphatase family metal-dependent hydrolase
MDTAHHVIIMGDFNDDPENDSIRREFYLTVDNVTAPLKKFHRGLNTGSNGIYLIKL